jgi:gliding motility-associated-like protein
METSIPIAVKPKPKVDYTVADNCLGGLVNFAGRVESVSDYNGFVWKWDFKDAGAVSASQNPGRTFSARGTYAVNLSVITNIGCVADTTKAVTVGPAPAAVLQNGSLAVCPGSAATFTVQAPVTDAVYTWYNAASGGTSLHSGNSLTIPNVAAGASYWVGANLNGCSSEARAEAKLSILPQLVVTTPVVASAGADRLIFSWEAVPTAIAYEVSIDGGASWITPSSGTTGLTHTVLGLTVGRSVTLQVRALGGCAPAVSQSVSGTTVSDQVFAPNTFTPNNRGNAENEKFRIYSNVISQIHLMIFNQWGQKVFETRDMFTGWDGSFKGKPQSSGVYIYVADIILTNGNRVQKKGAVNLIR